METKFVKGEAIFVAGVGEKFLATFDSIDGNMAAFNFPVTQLRSAAPIEDIEPVVTEELLNQIIIARPPKSLLNIDEAAAGIIEWVNQLLSTPDGDEAFERCVNLAGELPIGKLFKAIRSTRDLGTQLIQVGSVKEYPVGLSEVLNGN